MAAVPTIAIQSSLSQLKQPKSQGRPAHHLNDTQTLFKNPWESYTGHQAGFLSFLLQGWSILREWKGKPLPPPEEYVKVEKPNWAVVANSDSWAQDIKATWLGHACFLVELPGLLKTKSGDDLKTPARGPRLLFDPVFSQRCSPSPYLGPARLTPPPMPLQELPHVDIVILSHNHYDHTDVVTLKHIYSSQSKGSVHFFCALGNQKWFESIGFSRAHVTELDWWDARDAVIPLPATEDAKSTLTITCLPCQHFSGRSMADHFKTLWASWAIEQRPYEPSGASSEVAISKIWFGGDTGLRSVPRGRKQEDMPVCPVFKQIGERFGGFDLSLVPVGAYSPRGAFSHFHASPDDAVEIHLSVKSRRSIGMHWGCWALGDEAFMQDPQRLKQACVDRGVDPDVFNTLYIGETLRQAVGK